jgi:catechol 2,3-dioxygenase-like lactoylglutathione lyase family enzyme
VKVTGFHHVSVNRHDAALTDMVSFYAGLFGLESKERPEIPGVPGHWFNVSGQELHVVGAPPRGTDIDSTGNHFCITVEDLDQAIAELDDKDIPYQRAVQGAGTVQIWIIDPAGNTIELQQDRAVQA